MPERYDPAKAPRLYQPAVVNGANVALDPVTGQTLPNVFVGSFVPGTGDRYNGMVSSSDPNYPQGLPRQPGHRARAAPRRWRGTSPATARRRCTRAPACTTTRTSTRTGMDAMARNPPAQNTPSIFYGTHGHAAGAPARRARSPTARATCSASSATPRRRRASTTRPASSASSAGAPCST